MQLGWAKDPKSCCFHLSWIELHFSYSFIDKDTFSGKNIFDTHLLLLHKFT